jgi:hypothetical protein
MSTVPKYLSGPTTVIRVPIAIKAEVLDYAATLDAAQWVKATVFTIGHIADHRAKVLKKTRSRQNAA